MNSKGRKTRRQKLNHVKATCRKYSACGENSKTIQARPGLSYTKPSPNAKVCQSLTSVSDLSSFPSCSSFSQTSLSDAEFFRSSENSPQRSLIGENSLRSAANHSSQTSISDTAHPAVEKPSRTKLKSKIKRLTHAMSRLSVASTGSVSSASGKGAFKWIHALSFPFRQMKKTYPSLARLHRGKIPVSDDSESCESDWPSIKHVSSDVQPSVSHRHAAETTITIQREAGANSDPSLSTTSPNMRQTRFSIVSPRAVRPKFTKRVRRKASSNSGRPEISRASHSPLSSESRPPLKDDCFGDRSPSLCGSLRSSPVVSHRKVPARSEESLHQLKSHALSFAQQSKKFSLETDSPDAASDQNNTSELGSSIQAPPPVKSHSPLTSPSSTSRRSVRKRRCLPASEQQSSLSPPVPAARMPGQSGSFDRISDNSEHCHSPTQLLPCNSPTRPSHSVGPEPSLSQEGYWSALSQLTLNAADTVYREPEQILANAEHHYWKKKPMTAKSENCRPGHQLLNLANANPRQLEQTEKIVSTDYSQSQNVLKRANPGNGQLERTTKVANRETRQFEQKSKLANPEHSPPGQSLQFANTDNRQQKQRIKIGNPASRQPEETSKFANRDQGQPWHVLKFVNPNHRQLEQKVKVDKTVYSRPEDSLKFAKPENCQPGQPFNFANTDLCPHEQAIKTVKPNHRLPEETPKPVNPYQQHRRQTLKIANALHRQLEQTLKFANPDCHQPKQTLNIANPDHLETEYKLKCAKADHYRPEETLKFGNPDRGRPEHKLSVMNPDHRQLTQRSKLANPGNRQLGQSLSIATTSFSQREEMIKTAKLNHRQPEHQAMSLANSERHQRKQTLEIANTFHRQLEQTMKLGSADRGQSERMLKFANTENRRPAQSLNFESTYLRPPEKTIQIEKTNHCQPEHMLKLAISDQSQPESTLKFAKPEYRQPDDILMSANNEHRQSDPNLKFTNSKHHQPQHTLKVAISEHCKPEPTLKFAKPEYRQSEDILKFANTEHRQHEPILKFASPEHHQPEHTLKVAVSDHCQSELKLKFTNPEYRQPDDRLKFANTEHRLPESTLKFANQSESLKGISSTATFRVASSETIQSWDWSRPVISSQSVISSVSVEVDKTSPCSWNQQPCLVPSVSQHDKPKDTESFLQIKDDQRRTAAPQQQIENHQMVERKENMTAACERVSAEGDGRENKAHYLMVEVVYHGRALEAGEKSFVQGQVAQIVDGVVRSRTTGEETMTMHPTRRSYIGAPLTSMSRTSIKHVELQQGSICRINVEDVGSIDDLTGSSASSSVHSTMLKNLQQIQVSCEDMQGRFIKPRGEVRATPSMTSEYQAPGLQRPTDKFSVSASTKENDDIGCPLLVSESGIDQDGQITSCSSDSNFSRLTCKDATSLSALCRDVTCSLRRSPSKTSRCLPSPTSADSMMRFMNAFTDDCRSSPVTSHSIYSDRLVASSSRSALSAAGYQEQPAGFARITPSNPEFVQLSNFPPQMTENSAAFTQGFLTESKGDQSQSVDKTAVETQNGEQNQARCSVATDGRQYAQKRDCQANIQTFDYQTDSARGPPSVKKVYRSPTEHDAWWMPNEWARERRIGAYGTSWQFEPEVEQIREKELEVAKNPNVEQIRTCNFIRL